jgi:transposase InsO family protein
VPLPLQFFLVALAGWIQRHQLEVIEYQRAEIAALRQQLGKRRLVFTDAQRRRLARLGKALGRKRLREIGCLVSPDTILRWYRELIARQYDSSQKRRKPGRPRTQQELARLVVRLALENTRHGYTRIRDDLFGLGHALSRSTVKRILDEQGILPAPERGKHTRWRDFLAAHWGSLAAADFFTVEALTWRGLVRFHVLFVMELETRKVQIAGITSRPTGAWLSQIVRNLTDCYDGFLLGKRYLILDRDPLFTQGVRRSLGDSGVEVVRLPRRSPNLNAFAERFVLSVRSECLNHLLIFGEAHLRHVLAEFMSHYHCERPHQGLEGRLIEPDARVHPAEGEIVCRPRLGGLLRYYFRQAA